jgi:DNA repair protein RecO (recombination protein O)
MEAQRTEAIVLRVQPVTESSLIVTWFTRDFGKLKTMAKGARRLKGPFQGKIDLFYQDEIVFLPSRRSDLHLLQDCFLETAHKKLRESLEAVTAASYVCELVELATEPEDASARVFDLLRAALDAIEKFAKGRATVLLWFELQLLAACGWSQRWAKERGVKRVLQSLAGATVEGARRVRLNESQLHEAREGLSVFWQNHVGRLPRTQKLLADQIRH